jgi:hypothetical protein
MAAAFGMEMSGFRERVFDRAPLIIRRDLDAATAEAQAAQLREMGAEADALPDGDRLIWLRRAGRVCGPLPEPALDRYAEPGDQWCHDGGQEWFAWSPAGDDGEPPPLPSANQQHESPAFSVEDAQAEPPPLPEQPTAPPARGPVSTAAVIAALFGLIALLIHVLAPIALLLAVGVLIYLSRRPLLRGRAWALAALVLSISACFLWLQHPARAPEVLPYVPRPLQPLSNKAGAADASAQCAAKAAAPKNDEDRFLLTGQRLLTGRAQRKGDTYVAEAAVSVNDQCQPNALQLYVFRHGVFIGTALETAASAASIKLTDFDLVDDQHLRVTLAQCTDKPASCAATTVRQFMVMPGGGGWTLGEMK